MDPNGLPVSFAAWFVDQGECDRLVFRDVGLEKDGELLRSLQHFGWLKKLMPWQEIKLRGNRISVSEEMKVLDLKAGITGINLDFFAEPFVCP
jgi:hypothetical protein